MAMFSLLLPMLTTVAAYATHMAELSTDGEVSSIHSVRHKGTEEQISGMRIELPPEAEKGFTLTIVTNSSRALDPLLQTWTLDSMSTSQGNALALVGTLFTGLAFFYMVRQPRQDLQLHTWRLLSGNIGLLCTVLLFMAMKKIWKLCAGTATPGLDFAADIGSWLRFVILMFFFPLLRATLQTNGAAARPRLLAAMKVSGAYLIGFAGADCVSDVLENDPWSRNAGFYLLGILLVVIILAMLMALAFRVQAIGWPADSPYDPEHDVEQIDAAGFQIGFMLSMWVRFLIMGFLPGLKVGARALEKHDLYWMFFALVVSIMLLHLSMRLFRPIADDSTRNPWIRRLARTTTGASSMAAGWLLLYFVQWLFWYSTGNRDGSHSLGKFPALMAQALASTVVAIVSMIGAWYVADMAGHNIFDYTEIGNALVLSMGFSWEVAIYAIVVDVRDTTSAPARLGHGIIIILAVIALILPGWFVYIIPRTLDEVPHQKEGVAEATGSEDPPAATAGELAARGGDDDDESEDDAGGS